MLNDFDRHELLYRLRYLLFKFGRVDASHPDRKEQKANGVDVRQFPVRISVGGGKAELSKV